MSTVSQSVVSCKATFDQIRLVFKYIFNKQKNHGQNDHPSNRSNREVIKLYPHYQHHTKGNDNTTRYDQEYFQLDKTKNTTRFDWIILNQFGKSTDQQQCQNGQSQSMIVAGTFTFRKANMLFEINFPAIVFLAGLVIFESCSQASTVNNVEQKRDCRQEQEQDIVECVVAEDTVARLIVDCVDTEKNEEYVEQCVDVESEKQHVCVYDEFQDSNLKRNVGIEGKISTLKFESK